MKSIELVSCLVALIFWLVLGHFVSKKMVVKMCEQSSLDDHLKSRLLIFARKFSLAREVSLAVGRFLNHLKEFLISTVVLTGSLIGLSFEIASSVIWPLKIVRAYLILKMRERRELKQKNNKTH